MNRYRCFPKIGVSPKWMVYSGTPYQNGWFRGSTIFGNIHIQPSYIPGVFIATGNGRNPANHLRKRSFIPFFDGVFFNIPGVFFFFFREFWTINSSTVSPKKWWLWQKMSFSLGARSQASSMLIARACYVKLLNGCSIDEAMDTTTVWVL